MGKSRQNKEIDTGAFTLREGRDFYLEEGRMVFTAYFLQKRGYCCQSGCRHCPYGFHTKTSEKPTDHA